MNSTTLSQTVSSLLEGELTSEGILVLIALFVLIVHSLAYNPVARHIIPGFSDEQFFVRFIPIAMYLGTHFGAVFMTTEFNRARPVTPERPLTEAELMDRYFLRLAFVAFNVGVHFTSWFCYVVGRFRG